MYVYAGTSLHQKKTIWRIIISNVYFYLLQSVNDLHVTLIPPAIAIH